MGANSREMGTHSFTEQSTCSHYVITHHCGRDHACSAAAAVTPELTNLYPNVLVNKSARVKTSYISIGKTNTKWSLISNLLLRCKTSIKLA